LQKLLDLIYALRQSDEARFDPRKTLVGFDAALPLSLKIGTQLFELSFLTSDALANKLKIG
jgi:hypothetical protein